MLTKLHTGAYNELLPVIVVMMIEIQAIEGGWKICLLTKGNQIYKKKLAIILFKIYFAWNVTKSKN